MARPVLVALIALPLAGFAEPPPPPPPAAPPADARPVRPPPPGQPPDEAPPRKEKARPPRDEDRRASRDDDEGAMKRFKKRFQEMSPEEREHFKQNWQRWKAMPEEEKKHWKDRAKAERSRVRKTIDEAIAAAGLNLTENQREVFALRYRQERCRVEEALHTELEAKRDEKMKAVIEQLKKEFSPASAATPTPAPTP